MKNVLYFELKAVSVFEIFKFLSWLFGHISMRPKSQDKNDLMRNVSLISKLITSQPG